MSAAHTDILHIHHAATKPLGAADTGLLDAAPELTEIAWSLQLLRTTRIQVSLFRLILPLPFSCLPSVGCAAKALAGHLPDGSLVLMLIGEETDEEALAASMVEGFRSTTPSSETIKFAALHRPADLIGEPEEALLHLLALPTRTIDRHTEASAALQAA